MSPVETMEVDSPVADVEVEVAKKEVKDVDTTTTEGIVLKTFVVYYYLKLVIHPLESKVNISNV